MLFTAVDDPVMLKDFLPFTEKLTSAVLDSDHIPVPDVVVLGQPGAASVPDAHEVAPPPAACQLAVVPLEVRT